MLILSGTTNVPVVFFCWSFWQHLIIPSLHAFVCSFICLPVHNDNNGYLQQLSRAGPECLPPFFLMCIFSKFRTHTHMHAHTLTHAHTHGHTHGRTHVHTPSTRTHTHTHTHTHTLHACPSNCLSLRLPSGALLHQFCCTQSACCLAVLMVPQ